MSDLGLVGGGGGRVYDIRFIGSLLGFTVESWALRFEGSSKLARFSHLWYVHWGSCACSSWLAWLP